MSAPRHSHSQRCVRQARGDRVPWPCPHAPARALALQAPAAEGGRPPTARAPPPFRRHFALQQVRTDCFGTAVGAAVYLSLVPTLLGLHRPELVAVAVVSALLCVWPTALCRLGRKELYLRCRDYLILAQ